jgi:hypothetical protein
MIGKMKELAVKLVQDGKSLEGNSRRDLFNNSQVQHEIIIG